MNKKFGTEHRFDVYGKCGERAAKRSPGSVLMLRRALTLLLAAGFLLASISPAGQKDKKKKKDDASTSNTSLMSDQQQIDFMLSEMIGALQVGDVEKLHSTYADDVSIVSDNWAPPVMGWANYLAIYQQQRAHVQRVRMDRTNTFIKVKGDLAWACYQWNFIATVDGQPIQSRGQTTVVMEKRNGHWLIVHNHTSLTQPASGTPTTPTPQQAPAKPNGF